MGYTKNLMMAKDFVHDFVGGLLDRTEQDIDKQYDYLTELYHGVKDMTKDLYDTLSEEDKQKLDEQWEGEVEKELMK